MSDPPLDTVSGREIRDNYGRLVGVAVGYTLDLTGRLRTVGVERGTESFVEYAAERFLPTGEGYILLPEWKVKGNKTQIENGALQKRVRALTVMLESGEVERPMYETMLRELSDEVEPESQLPRTLEERLEQLDRDDQSIEVFQTTVRLHAKAGEITEDVYAATAERCGRLRTRNDRERLELREFLGLLKQKPEGIPETERSGQAAQEAFREPRAYAGLRSLQTPE